MEIILNNREEIFDYIKKNIQRIHPKGYVMKLQTVIEEPWRIWLLGGISGERHISALLSFPVSNEKYPVIFEEGTNLDNEYWWKPSINQENIWLLRMLIRELIGRAL